MNTPEHEKSRTERVMHSVVVISLSALSLHLILDDEYAYYMSPLGAVGFVLSVCLMYGILYVDKHPRT